MLFYLFVIISVAIIFLVLLVIGFSSRQADSIHWVETNAKILKSEFSRHTFGNDISRAKGEASRRVKLTVEIKLTKAEKVVVSRTVWTQTKNRWMFEEGQYVAILYDSAKPVRFKLKYTI